jgi:HSP20 family protein
MAEEKKKKKAKKGDDAERSEKLAVQEQAAWQPFDIMRRMDQEFEDFRRNIERSLWWPSTWSRGSMFRWPEFRTLDIKQPLIDIKDTGTELIVEAELPGIPKENIDIQVTENSIEICGEVKSLEEKEKEGYYRQERSYSTCYRQTPLPDEVIPSKADATMENGILKVKIPKKKPIKDTKAHSVKVR